MCFYNEDVDHIYAIESWLQLIAINVLMKYFMTKTCKIKRVNTHHSTTPFEKLAELHYKTQSVKNRKYKLINCIWK